MNPPTHETVDKKMHYVHQDGQAVFKFAVRKMAEVCDTLLKRNGLTGHDVNAFIPHQANKRIILNTAERLGMDLDKVIINIDRYGNTTSATIPLAPQPVAPPNMNSRPPPTAAALACRSTGMEVSRRQRSVFGS